MERALERAPSRLAWSRSQPALEREHARGRLRTRVRKARRAAGPASSRGKTSFQLAEPVISTRSAPAAIERSAASATHERRSTASASMLSVMTTPS